jgi:hypothetical protein
MSVNKLLVSEKHKARVITYPRMKLSRFSSGKFKGTRSSTQRKAASKSRSLWLLGEFVLL